MLEAKGVADSQHEIADLHHIAAVVLPALLGIVWVTNSSAVFLIGAGIAALSLTLSQLIPDSPQPQLETRLSATR